MTRFLTAIALALALAPILHASDAAQPISPPPVKLWRLDCGTFSAPVEDFSDLFAHPGQRASYVVSCYLIRHGKELMLWDAGLPLALKNQPDNLSTPIRMQLQVTIVEQLARLGFKPTEVTILGISHNHWDHTSQASAFTQARLMMDKDDFEALRHTPAPFFSDASTLQPWLSGDAVKELISGDHDVFGDGSVVMVALPGHTPGNHGLLIHLGHSGIILISGDALHVPEQLTNHALPPSNTSRAESLASLDRIVGIMRDAHATLVIEHDPKSVAKLPAFPQAAD